MDPWESGVVKSVWLAVWGTSFAVFFVDDTSSVVCWMRFVAICAFDILVWGCSGALACEVVLCTFNAPRRITTIVLRVPIFLAPHTLWDIAFGVWCLDFHDCV